jgi:hypothetical protein
MSDKKLKCPRCGESPVAIQEVMGTVLEWDVLDGVIIGTGNEGIGELISTHAICRCGHRWASPSVRSALDRAVDRLQEEFFERR